MVEIPAGQAKELVGVRASQARERDGRSSAFAHGCKHPEGYGVLSRTSRLMARSRCGIEARRVRPLPNVALKLAALRVAAGSLRSPAASYGERRSLTPAR